MALGKRRAQTSDADNFYISWGDLVSLLLVFFIYLFSISEIDVVKFLEASNSMQEEIVKVKIKDATMERLKIAQKKLQDIKTEVDNYIDAEELQEVLSAELFDDRLELRMGNVLLFEIGSADLKNKAKEVLGRIGGMFKSEQIKIIVEGHSDDIPISTAQFPSNWELSSARAASVVRFLTSIGVPEYQFLVMGYNQYSPLVPNNNPANRAKNRRVRIIIKPDVEKILQSNREKSQKQILKTGKATKIRVEENS